MPHGRLNGALAALAVPGMYLVSKYSEFKRQQEEATRRRVTEKELQHLNHKIDKLLTKLDDPEALERAQTMDDECVVCLNAKATMQTYPCGHCVVCRVCFIKTIQSAVTERCLPLRCVVCRARILQLKQRENTPGSNAGGATSGSELSPIIDENGNPLPANAARSRGRRAADTNNNKYQISHHGTPSGGRRGVGRHSRVKYIETSSPQEAWPTEMAAVRNSTRSRRQQVQQPRLQMEQPQQQRPLVVPPMVLLREQPRRHASPVQSPPPKKDHQRHLEAAVLDMEKPHRRLHRSNGDTTFTFYYHNDCSRERPRLESSKAAPFTQ